MIKRLFIVFLLCLPGASALASFDIPQLMAALAAHPGGKATFVETRHLAILDEPIVSRGEMVYTPPARLEKRTLTPKPETLIFDRDRLTLERGTQKLSVNLASQPQAMAFVDSILGTLAGQHERLERNYALHLEGTPDAWTLHLAAREEMAEFVLRMEIRGDGGQVRNIEYLQADGDRTELAITPTEAP